MTLEILIVDDNPDDREAAQRTMARMKGFVGTVREAKDGASCLETLSDNPGIDCVLLDFSLPGQDGAQVLSHILERDPAAAVVMITGQGDERIAVECMKLGARDYISKDRMSVASLKRAISNATERARMERKIRDQQESLQTFAQVIVHDLRTPLRGILQAIEMLSEDLSKAAVGENTEMLDYVVKSAERMDALILALKSYTDVDGAPPVFEPVDLDARVDDVRANLAPVMDETGASIHCETPLPTVHGNTPQIEQLFQNLIGNGIKFNTSATPEIRISAAEEPDHWVICITDNGIGIAPEFLERVFEPFKRLHRSDEFEGTGLGLATCKKIADRHGGRLTCRSEPGSGSSFYVAFPKEPAFG